jgi:hypothetical protein
VPRLRLVVVTTAVPAPDDGRREHQRAIYDLMERHLIPTAEKKLFALSRAKSSLNRTDGPNSLASNLPLRLNS